MKINSDPLTKSRYAFLKIFLVTLTALLLGTYGYYLWIVDDIRYREYVELSAVAQTRIELINNWRRERLADVKVISKAPLVSERLLNLAKGQADKVAKTSILESLDVIMKAYGYSEGLILNPESQLLLSTLPYPDVVDPVEKDAIQECFRQMTPTLGEPYHNSKGQIMMDVLAPLSDSSGLPMGVAVLRINAQNRLFPLIGTWPTPSQTAGSIIVRRDGGEVTILNDLRNKTGKALSVRFPITETHLPAVQAVLGKVGLFQGKNSRDEDVLADLRKIPDSSWFMITEANVDEIIAKARSRSIAIGLFCLMATTILVGTIAYVSRYRQSRLYEGLYQSERLQREAQEEFRVTLYSIGDAVITTDRDGVVKQMNPVAELLTGWLESEGKGRQLEEVFHIVNERSREPVNTAVEKVLKNGKLVGLANHTLLISRNGSERPIADSASPITDRDGSIIGVVLVFRDQTEERAALHRLKVSQQRLTTIADHIYDWEYWVTPDNQLEFCSPSCQRLTGYSQTEFMNDPELIRKIVQPDDLAVYDQHVANVSSHSGLSELDFRIIAKDGRVVWLSHCCTAVNGIGGQPLGWRISNRDVTERKLVEEERKKSLERQNRLNQLQQVLLAPGSLLLKLKMITDTVVDVFEADFCRIWRIVPGDLCERGCMHSEATEGPHVCLDRNRCLRLEASSGRYTHTDGEKHRRVPFGAYKIGRVASGEDHKFLTNDAVNDPRIHDHEWARELGLVSFVGYQLSPPDGERLGVLALFCKHPISNEEDAQLDALSSTVARLIHSATIEETLHESEERFRTAFLTSPDAITISQLSGDEKGFYVDFNDGFQDLTGYEREEVIGKSSLDIGLWHDPEDRGRMLAELKKSGVVTNLETRFCLKDCRVKAVLVSARVINLNGTPHVLAVARDVDEWKKAEDALRMSEERFRQAAEFVGDWIWELDKDGLFTYCSAAVYQALGYMPEELVGKRYFWEILDSSNVDDSALTPHEHFDAKKWFKGYVTHHVHKDGRTVTMETSGAPLLDNGGNFAGYRGTNTDITERVKASESRELLAAVVDHATESIVVTDTSGTIRYVNPAFERATGYAKEEVIGGNPRALKSGKHSDHFYVDLWNTIERGEAWHGHFINKKKDGSLFEEEATISPLRGPSGEIANYVAVKRDVTKEVSLQNQLVQSQKMEAIGTLAGGIAHDFNNMLFAIIGYTEMALDDLPEGSRSRGNLKQVLTASKRAADMVRQILTFSRRTEPQKMMLDLTPIIKEGLKFLRGSIPASIDIRQYIGTSLGKIEADPTQMHQVLMNLCTNAAQSMKETNGTMTVELSDITLDAEYSARHLSVKPGRYIKLAVSDTGHGIPAENLDRIFEPYFTTKGIGEGTGLGLAVVHGIVTGHGGAISVYSLPEQGSTFSVFLPVAQHESLLELALGETENPLGSERILLVDDEEMLIDMGQSILERLGYKVVTSVDPLAALEIFRSDASAFDLIVTDLMMPIMNGLELARDIKVLNPDIPIILCSGFGHKLTEQEANQRGLSGIISKPISKGEMARVIRKVLDKESPGGDEDRL